LETNIFGSGRFPREQPTRPTALPPVDTHGKMAGEMYGRARKSRRRPNGGTDANAGSRYDSVAGR
jgi:hypothetical protein